MRLRYLQTKPRPASLGRSKYPVAPRPVQRLGRRQREGSRRERRLKLTVCSRLAWSLTTSNQHMATDRTPTMAELAKLAVARISHGPAPYLPVSKALEEAARAVLA